MTDCALRNAQTFTSQMAHVLKRNLIKRKHAPVRENQLSAGDARRFVAEGEGVSVRGHAAPAGETLWGRLPCNPTLTVRPAPLREPSLTALNCYLRQTCLPDNRQAGVPPRPGLHGVKGMRVGGRNAPHMEMGGCIGFCHVDSCQGDNVLIYICLCM